MSLFQSPHHELATNGPEQFSTTDETDYAAVYIRAAEGNSASFQTGGAQITPTLHGERVGGDGVRGFWFAIPGRAVRLTQIYVCGEPGDVAESICIPALA